MNCTHVRQKHTQVYVVDGRERTPSTLYRQCKDCPAYWIETRAEAFRTDATPRTSRVTRNDK